MSLRFANDFCPGFIDQKQMMESQEGSSKIGLEMNLTKNNMTNEYGNRNVITVNGQTIEEVKLHVYSRQLIFNK